VSCRLAGRASVRIVAIRTGQRIGARYAMQN
jgi:hypothetical protein